jgi:hypothetical protein
MVRRIEEEGWTVAAAAEAAVLSYSHSGIGSPQHMAEELIAVAGGPAINGALSGASHYGCSA